MIFGLQMPAHTDSVITYRKSPLALDFPPVLDQAAHEELHMVDILLMSLYSLSHTRHVR